MASQSNKLGQSEPAAAAESEATPPPCNGATIEHSAAIDRWVVYDHSGAAVAFRRVREEAEAIASELPPKPPGRKRPELPTPTVWPPVTFKELRPGFFDRRPTPRVVLQRPRNR